MKKIGSTFEYEDMRDADIMRAYREQVSRYCCNSMSEVFRAIVDMPSRRFWVSEERAAVVVAAMFRGEQPATMRAAKREMYGEIYQRCVALRDANPAMPIRDIVAAVVKQPAPKFYMTPGSVKVLFYKIRGRWQKERLKKRKL